MLLIEATVSSRLHTINEHNDSLYLLQPNKPLNQFQGRLNKSSIRNCSRKYQVYDCVPSQLRRRSSRAWIGQGPNLPLGFLRPLIWVYHLLFAPETKRHIFDVLSRNHIQVHTSVGNPNQLSSLQLRPSALRRCHTTPLAPSRLLCDPGSPNRCYGRPLER